MWFHQELCWRFFCVLTVQFWLQPLSETFNYVFLMKLLLMSQSYVSLCYLSNIWTCVQSERIVDLLLKAGHVSIDWQETRIGRFSAWLTTTGNRPIGVGYIQFCASHIYTHAVNKLCVVRDVSRAARCFSFSTFRKLQFYWHRLSDPA